MAVISGISSTTTRTRRASFPGFLFLLRLLLVLHSSRVIQQLAAAKVVVAAASSLSSSSSSSSSSSCYPGGSFLWLSDAHYDAFYGTEQAEVHKNGAPCMNNSNNNNNNGTTSSSGAPLYSAYGCGSSLALLTSAVKESARLSSDLLTTLRDDTNDDFDAATDNNETNSSASSASSSSSCRVDFIIFTGDAVRHNIDPVASTLNAHGALVNAALTTVHALFEQYFPGVPTVDLPALDFGNNDLLGDYELNVTSSEPCLPSSSDGSPPPATNDWLVNVTATHSHLFIDDLEAAVFACGGYLNRLVRPNLRIISLNTIVWSINHIPDMNDEIMMDPFGQFAWLQVQLDNARIAGDKIYLTGHVPPMLQSYTGSLGAPLMPSRYIAQYFAMLSAHQDVIAAQLFGHVHSNELRAVPHGAMPDDAPPMLIQGSIAPCYTTTPFFSVVKYDRDGPTKYPTDLVTYHVDLDLYYNETTSSSSSSTSNSTNSSSIWKRMFISLTTSLGMAALTNAETRRLAERMATSDDSNDTDTAGCGSSGNSTARCISIFQHYFDYWYKGIPQTDCNTATCHLQEACLVYNGFNETIWQDCVSNGSAVQTPPPVTSSSSSSVVPSLLLTFGGGGGFVGGSAGLTMTMCVMLLLSAVVSF
jgi:hypothetical protein